MNKEDMILVSVDDHIVEPPDMFNNHLPQKLSLIHISEPTRH